MVRQDDPLPAAGKNHGVLADHRATAQRGKTDGAGRARAGDPIAHAHTVVGKGDVATGRRRYDRDRCAGKSGRQILDRAQHPEARARA